MKITLQNTKAVTELNGIRHRIWEGETDGGIKITAFITVVAVKEDFHQEDFQKEFKETKLLKCSKAWSLRMLI